MAKINKIIQEIGRFSDIYEKSTDTCDIATMKDLNHALNILNRTKY